MLIYHQLVVLIFVCFRSKVLLTLIFYFYLFANDPPMALEKALNECQKGGIIYFSPTDSAEH